MIITLLRISRLGKLDDENYIKYHTQSRGENIDTFYGFQQGICVMG